jgi:hypothetical protein
LTHIVDEYKQRFLQDTDFAITNFNLENNIEFANSRRIGESKPYNVQMRDEVRLTVTLEVVGDNHRPKPFDDFTDENFKLVSSKIHVEPLYPFGYGRTNVYTYELNYFIIKN